MEDWTLILMGYVVLTLGGRMVAHHQRSAPASTAKQTRSIMREWDALLVAASAGTAILLPVLEAALREQAPGNLPLTVLGAAVIVVGWAIAYMANREIGKNWSPVVDKTGEQRLVTSGIYSFIRHPLYLSGLVVVLGTNLYFQGTWGWLGLPLVAVATIVRVPLEERHLVERFGDAYSVYQGSSKAVVPWLY